MSTGGRTYWNPGRLLNITDNEDAYEVQCVGYARTTGSRCGWRIRDPGASKICAVLARMAAKPPGQTTHDDLRDLAGLCLCRDWHYDQAAGKASTWDGKVRQAAATAAVEAQRARAAEEAQRAKAAEDARRAKAMEDARRAKAAAEAQAQAQAQAQKQLVVQAAKPAPMFVFGGGNNSALITPPATQDPPASSPGAAPVNNNFTAPNFNPFGAAPVRRNPSPSPPSPQLFGTAPKSPSASPAPPQQQSANEQKIRQLVKDLVDIKIKLSSSEATNAELLRNSKDTQSNLRASQARTLELEAKLANVAVTEELLEDAETKIKKLEKQVEEQVTQIAGLDRVIDGFEELAESGEQSHAEMSEQLNVLEAEREEWLQRNTLQEEEIARLRSENETMGGRCKDLSVEGDGMRTVNQKLTTINQKLTKDAEEAASRHEKLLVDKKTLETEVALLQSRLGDVEDRNKKAVDEVRAEQAANSGLQKEVSTLKARIGELEATLSSTWWKRFRAWVRGVKRGGSAPASSWSSEKAKSSSRAATVGKRAAMVVTPVRA